MATADVFIPSSARIKFFSSLIELNYEEIDKIQRDFDINELCITPGTPISEDVDNLTFYTKPFISNPNIDSLIILNVSLLPILALNCIYTPKGLENLDSYQALLERYNFLEHIRFDLLPEKLASFLILNNYNFALGDNNQVGNIASKILKKYEHIELNKNAYLFKLPLIENLKIAPVLGKTWKQRIDYHFEIMKKDFYDDKHTIHEPILFLLSNTGASVFYLTIFSYLFRNYSDIFNQQPFYIVCITTIAMCLSFLTSVYLFTITGGRLAITLGKKEVSDNMVILIISSIVLSIFVTMFIGILMTAPTTN